MIVMITDDMTMNPTGSVDTGSSITVLVKTFIIDKNVLPQQKLDFFELMAFVK